MVTAAAHASYDEMPYEGGLVVGSHPEHLATVGRLFGMTPAPIERCRVLEIGCATGMNLLAMAYSLPGCEFVGIDPSGRQIELGRKALAEYGITNVELATTDVREAVEWQREFDYIVCHGVFSWVAPDVQEAILAACRRLLAPQGLRSSATTPSPASTCAPRWARCFAFTPDTSRSPESGRTRRGRS
ncbi:MAG: class I SAM-dependent methyltransferase [Dehalococcoidia bacterium]|nr:class I SAM-dependent methyltransferase [Dehalococcoidia bacterium]